MSETRVPRRRVDWATTLLGSIIVFLLGYGTNGLSDLRKDVSELKIGFATLGKTVELGMSDRFTGQEGAALTARVDRLEEESADYDGRLHLVEGACAILRERRAKDQ